MSVEDSNDGEEIQPDKDGKYPETVPWNKYVGIKESLGKKIETAENKTKEAEGKVGSLEEKLKNAVTPEDHQRVKEELDEAKTNLQTKTDELETVKTKTLTEKRETLTKRGIPEEKIKDMSERELDAALLTVEHSKPNPDMGAGAGGSDVPKGDPMELARRAYASSNE